ncbi:MAG TPA: hypothetical protein VFX45_05830 [Solirubrobacterales bacterium]|nr:hypothetical protein [Solirubrobacterales bacterium]
MKWGLRRPGPALVIACIALFAALGGTVYAAKKLDGHAVKMKSLPGNRLAMASVPGNRLKPGAIPGNRIAPGSITGTQIDVATLGQVPSAVHADNADSAHDAETALVAANAHDAKTVNGHSAGCTAATRFFAGACWQVSTSDSALSAPAAAMACASQGGELPEALELAAFSQQAGIALDGGGEWSGDLTNFSGLDVYAVLTISPSAQVGSAPSTATKRYRCVIPLLT